MKLYELPNRSFFRLLADETVPPAAPAVTTGEVYYLGNIDGMYSYCRDRNGHVVHVIASAEVEAVDRPDDWRGTDGKR